MIEENKNIPPQARFVWSNKQLVSIIAVALVLLLGAGYYFIFHAYVTPQENEIVATVGNEVITKHDIDVRVRQSLVSGSKVGFTVPEDAFFDRALDSLIDESLVYQDASREGYSATEAEVEARYGIALSKFSSEDAFFERMEANLLTPEEFKKNISRQIVLFAYIEELRRREVQAELDALPQQTTDSGATLVITADRTPVTQDDINRLTKERAEELKEVFPVTVHIN